VKPRVRIKYCGGCNPQYDRVALVEELQTRLGGTVEWVSTDDVDTIDLVLVVQGCDTACADLSAFDGHEIYPITRPDDAAGFIARIRADLPREA